MTTEYRISERLVIDKKIEFRQALKSFQKSLKEAKKSNESKRRKEVNYCLSDFYAIVNHFVVDGKFFPHSIFDTIIRTFEEEIVPLLNCGRYLRPDLWAQMSWVCIICIFDLREEKAAKFRQKAVKRLFKWLKDDSEEEFKLEEMMGFFTNKIEQTTAVPDGLDFKYEHDVCMKCIGN